MKLTLTRIAALTLMILLFLVPTRAQDVPPESTVEAGTVTILDGNGDGVDITITAPTETPVEVPVTPEPWYAKYIAGLLGIGGIIYGLLKAANKWLEGRKTDTATMTFAEQGYRRSPGPLKSFIVGMIKEFIRLGGNLQEILKEVEDDVPFAVKQATGTTVTPGPVPPYAVNVSGVPIANSQTPTANLPKDLTNLHELGGASTGGGEGFR